MIPARASVSILVTAGMLLAHNPISAASLRSFRASLFLQEETGEEQESRDDEKARVPGEEERAVAEKTLLEVYGKELARANEDVEARRKLARDLSERADQLEALPEQRYVVLLKAYELAIAGRDCERGLEVIEKIDAAFAPIDRRALRHRLVREAAPGLYSEAQANRVVALGFELIDEDLELEDAASGREILEAINQRARKAGEKSRLDSAKAALEELATYLEAVATLEKDREDAAANEVVGRRLTFVKGLTERGLMHLTKAPEGPLRQCAVLDVANPSAFEGELAAGSAWLDWSEKQKGAAGDFARDRARFWFERAGAHAPGIEQKLVEEKLKKLGEDTPVASAGPRAKAERPVKSGSKVERAVSLALDWLVAHQSEDGSWDCDGFSENCGKLGSTTCDGPGGGVHDVGVTGLAVLALGHARGDDERYASAARKGLKWLVSEQTPDGDFGKVESNDWIYDHAIGTLAMTEVGTDLGEEFKASAQKAIFRVFAARNPYGAWRYQLIGDNDVSVTGWMILALSAAKSQGLEGDYKAAFEGALSFINEVSDPGSGLVGYSTFGELSSRTPANEHFPREKGEAMTAVGLSCRFLLGEEPKGVPIMKKHAELLKAKPPLWDEEGYGSDFYYWHHATLAMRRMGEPYWRNWSRLLTSALVETQRDGKEDERGSWDPIDAWSYAGGRIYATTLNCMSLQVCLDDIGLGR